METVGAPSVPAQAPTLDLDLGEAARAMVRQRRAPTSLGLSLGGAFVAIGLVELAVLPHDAFAPELVIAGLLVALGVGLIVLTLRSGYLNPVVGLRTERGRLRVVRRFGPVVVLDPADPDFGLDLEDLGPDPASRPHEKTFVFFTAPGPVYGNLPPKAVGALLDWARGSGLSVRMRLTSVGGGRVPHRVRRIRIRSPDEGAPA